MTRAVLVALLFVLTADAWGAREAPCPENRPECQQRVQEQTLAVEAVYPHRAEPVETSPARRTTGREVAQLYGGILVALAALLGPMVLAPRLLAGCRQR